MSLGSLITQARKSAGLSIEDLSASTNIRATLLKEIEANNFANCGGETYARGHIRNIAAKVGADQQLFLTAFEDEQTHSDRSMRDLLVENSVMREPGQARKVSWKVLATISVSSLFVVGVAQIVISNSSTSQLPKPITTQSTSSQSPEATQPSPSQTPTEQATVSTGTGVELIISAVRAKSWIFVSDATGRTLFSGQIAQGGIKTFSTDVLLNLRIGNAGGVDLTVNGKKIDSVGANGQVVSVSYGVDS